jgi:hypothetical protein
MAATLAVILLASVAIAAAASESPRSDTTTDDIPVLVQQLGATKFLDRQRASQRLLNSGIAAEPALRTAVAGPDAEVRDRAARILERISAADFESRLEAFAADIEGKQHHELPAWQRFSKLFGADETARSLFVEMQRAEPELLRLLDSSSPNIADTFARRCEELSTGPEAFNPDGKGGPSVGSVATVMFVGISPDLKIDEQAGLQVFGLIQPMLQAGSRRGPWLPLFRQMTVQWIQKDSGPAIAFQNLWLAFNFDLREGLQLAERVLRSEPVPTEVAPFAVLVAARFGTKEQMPLIEPLLRDSTSIVAEESEGERMSTQVRDVALAALVHLSGQDTKAYGFDESLPHHEIVFQPGKYGFANSAKRNLAHKKWSDWQASQPR